MSQKSLPIWFPTKPSIYAIDKSYAENASDGPFFTGEIPERNLPPEKEWFDFLGHRVASPIGVPAGPLLNSNWIALASKLGFDIPVYKTIRANAHPGHPLPNMIYVSPQGDGTATQRENMPEKNEELSLTNSFGMPSRTPDFLLEDIPRAQASLSKGQVLVVSVVGSVTQERSFQEDFIEAALLAKRAGAQIIEANFSCPNVGKEHGSLYTDPMAVEHLGKALVQAIGSIPLIIKVGSFPNENLLKQVLLSASKAGIRAISGLNSVSMRVTDKLGNPALGTSRQTSGICGATIRPAALEFVRCAAKIIAREKLDLTLIGVGGIVAPEHFDDFYRAGATVAMTATGMMWDPYLASRYHEEKHASFCP